MTMKPSVSPAIAATLPVTAIAPDPIHTDGDKYKVLLENEHVRVLAYTDQPGEKTHLHQHPQFVLYTLAPFKRKLGLADGRTFEREFTAGEVLYSRGETHCGENIGSTPTRIIMVELKPQKKLETE
jgi:mannose-6-phosphate isomerase-like protein (cupin superfamily)